MRGGQTAVDTTIDLITTFSQGKMNPEMFANYSPGAERYATIWQDVIDAAEEFNDPGNFTTLIGYEWTSLEKGANLHRNVVFRDGKDKVGQIVPFTILFSICFHHILVCYYFTNCHYGCHPPGLGKLSRSCGVLGAVNPLFCS